jgi:hypothetical protein
MKEIQRDLYLQKLIARKENGLIKIITGIRRCGKSYLLFNIYRDYLLSLGVDEKHIIALNLDDDRNRQYRNPDNLSDYLYSKITNDKEMFYILLDEVQFVISNEEVKSGEPIRLYGILNGLIRMRNVDVYVTGSNSKFLSSDVKTEFRGRGDEIRVHALTFAEYMSAYSGNKYEGWKDYYNYGGLPFILSCSTDEQKSKYLNDLFDNVYLKDIIERYHLHERNCIDTLVNILASSIGSLTNPKKLSDTFASNGLKISEHTISSYISYMQDAFLISKAERYDIKGKKYINSPFKFYYTDVGLRNSRLNFRQQEENHIMENIIYNELLVRGFNVDVGIVNVRIRNNGVQEQKQTEVDFVCNKASQRYYIQSAFAIPDNQKMEQEQYSLTHINDHFKKIIVVKDDIKPWRNEKGVLIVGILDFLLNPNSLEL